MKTSTIKISAPAWHLIDAADQTLGRVAARVARILRGKHKPSFSPHQLCGDHVVIVNMEKLKIDPGTAQKKLYYHHSGYLGSMKKKTLKKVMQDRPEEAMEHAVHGMLPRNRLRPQMLKRLHIFVGGEHPYAAQKPVPHDLTTL